MSIEVDEQVIKKLNGSTEYEIERPKLESISSISGSKSVMDEFMKKF